MSYGGQLADEHATELRWLCRSSSTGGMPPDSRQTDKD